MRLNDQQLSAVRKCVQWYFTESYIKHVFALAGLAGTGKSSTAKIIINLLGIGGDNVIFATLTGKASLVLRLKGNQSNTIHKTFYITFKNGKSFRFSLKKRIASNIRLIVIDEASMVNQSMLDDIISFNIPVLLLFDPGQLPAIFGSNIYVNDSTRSDVFLTQIMRQDDESGILDLASKARLGEPLEFGKYKNSLVTSADMIIDKLHTYDMIITFSNKLRRLINLRVRAQKGYTSIYPQKGEKLLCLANNYNYNVEYNDIPIYLINGLQGYVTEDSKLYDHEELDTVKIKFIPDFIMGHDGNGHNYEFDVPCYKEIFEQYCKDPSREAFLETMYEEADDETIGEIGMLDFGYCLTCHKSQGSEAPNVLVLVERKIPSNIYAKWLYTAITRAQESVTVATFE